LAVPIKDIHKNNRRVYGSPRVHQALMSQGEVVCVNTVAKIKKDDGIKAKTKRKFTPRTTDSHHHQPVAKNVLNREFDAAKPDCKWATDITYIPTEQGWLYLAAVIDLCSRKVVG